MPDNRTLEIPYSSLQKMPEGAAILLAYLQHESMKMHQAIMERWIAHHKFPPEPGDDALYDMYDSHWYPFGADKIKADIGMTFCRQTKYLKLLQKRKLIKFAKKGLPASRWVYVPQD